MIPFDPSTKRVFDLLPNYVAKYNLPDVLANKVNGEWVKYSAQDVIQKANTLSKGLLALGVQKDDKIALIGGNRPEWNLVDLGVQQTGAVLVPMYPTISIEDYHYIFKDAGVKYVFVADAALFAKASKGAEGLEAIKGIFTFDPVAGAQNWQSVLDLSASVDDAALQAAKDAVTPEDLLTLIYTSGTTGTPKGVMLTHDNITSNVEAAMGIMPQQGDELALSFLPLCHIYERTTIYIYMRLGIATYYAESMDTIAENIREVRPHVFTTVPRLLEKVYDKIVAKGYELTGVKRSLFFWALNLGLKYDPNTSGGWWYDTQLKWAQKLIFSKWQEALGGRVRLICSGAAALQPRLMRVFWAAGIPVSEGYGLTETSPVISSNKVNPLDLRVGTVGTIISGVTVKIAEDGEILIKGPNVMKGYYNKPEATAEAIDSEGWFHTGDVGTLVEGRFLKITDRKKEIFKTSGGKYVAPQMVENKMKESMLIEQVVVVGEGQKFPSALVVPEFNALREWCNENGLSYTTDAEMVKNTQVLTKLNEEVQTLNRDIAKYEQVKKIEVLPALMSIEGGELTPTLKLKRKKISEKYQHLIEGMYK
jgi:long-chain acyl-CoA synthetase